MGNRLAFRCFIALIGVLAFVVTSLAAPRLASAASPCTISGTAGSDTLTGTARADVICGLGGNDVIKGLGGNDQLKGGAGSDTFVASTTADGADTIVGGSGKDTASYAARTGAVAVTLDGKANDGATGEGDNVGGDVENVTSGSGADRLSGSALGNRLDSGAGNDALSGLDGDDLLFAGYGNDSLRGGPGTDRCDPGLGTDTASECEPFDVVRLTGTIGADRKLSPVYARAYVIDGTATVKAGVTLTLAPGAVLKGGSLDVNGTVSAAGTSGRRAILTSWRDDSVGGATDGGNYTAPAAADFDIAIEARGGTLNLNQADLRFAGITTPSSEGTPTVTVRNSALRDSYLQLSRGDVRFKSNSFVRTPLWLQSLSAPVVQDNTFADSQLSDGSATQPLLVDKVGDLAGIHSNTATGGAVQRTFCIMQSTVASSWTVDPASRAIYDLDTVTIDPGATMTISPEAAVKSGPTNGDSIRVEGTLRVSATEATRPILTSAVDDSVGGSTDCNGGRSYEPTAGDFDIQVLPGGTLDLDQADLRFAGITTPSSEGTPTVTVRNSALRDSYLQLSRGDVRFKSNSFVRTPLWLQSLSAPVVQDNTFADSQLSDGSATQPLLVDKVGDLAGIHSNTATGGAVQRTFYIMQSTVASSWTVDPANNGVYRLDGVTVADGATMTVSSDAVLKNSGDASLTVSKGGTLKATDATFTSYGDDSVEGDSDGDDGPGTWSGIDAELGSTVTISGSLLKNASIAIDANSGWETSTTPYADVTVTGSTFEGNGFDIENGYKDWPLIGKPVTVIGSAVNPALVSFHWHTCVPPPTDPPLPTVEIKIWDVEWGVPDDTCPPDYTERKNHP